MNGAAALPCTAATERVCHSPYVADRFTRDWLGFSFASASFRG